MPTALITSLEQSASDATIEIMLMNVVMSAGTAVLHERAGNTEQASSSRRTSARARVLVNALLDKLPAMQSSLTALNAAVASENGREVLFLQPGAVAAEGETSFVLAASEEEAVDTWLAFIARWKYDKGQLSEIAEALSLCGAAGQ